MKEIIISNDLTFGQMFDKIRKKLKVGEVVKISDNEYWRKVRINKKHDYSSIIRTEIRYADYIIKRE